MDYKSMTTPMAPNLNLLSFASSESLDSTMYLQMICSFMYMMSTRLDICFAVNTLRNVHLMILKHALRYVKGIVDYQLKYEANKNINLEGYMDSYWEDGAINKKST